MAELSIGEESYDGQQITDDPTWIVEYAMLILGNMDS